MSDAEVEVSEIKASCFLIYELVEKSTDKTGLINLRLKGLQKAGCMGFLLDHCQLLNFENMRAAQLSLGRLSESSKV